ncbi:MAG: NAD(+) diphosphatase [Euzebya sp.]
MSTDTDAGLPGGPNRIVVATRASDGFVQVTTGGWPDGVDPNAHQTMAAACVTVVIVDDDSTWPADGFTDARSAMLDRDDTPALLAAVALGQWRIRNRFCSRCGGILAAQNGGRILRCEQDHQHFPHIEPAVIMRVTDAADRILLARQPSWMPGRFSVLAGFVDPGESLEQAVRREVMEEVGVAVDDVRYVKSQPWPFPSSLMLAFSARAMGTDLRLEEEEIAEAAWFSREELRDALAAGELAISPPISVAYQLICAWMGTDL